MIKSVNNYPVSTLLDIESVVVYAIPRYQREYKWGKGSWDNLFDDLLENDPNYFLGSIICINQTEDALAIQQLELVDGQQRMTTLSILLAAIYQAYDDLPTANNLPFEAQIERHNLKHRLVLKKDATKPRLIPQVQNENQQDYFAVLKMAGIISIADTVSNAGNRRVFKAYRHFKDRIREYINPQPDPLQALVRLVEKVNSATLVKIEVASHSDAYTLFESLNNRGVPLTAVDLIKNKLLAKLEYAEPGNIERHFNQWGKVIKALSDDYALQERYFRQYYNAFKLELKSIVSVPVATKSNLMQVYEKLINHNAGEFLNNALASSALYRQITARELIPNKPKLSQLLLQLERAQAAPAYVFLLFVFSRAEELELDEDLLERITGLLIRFFVRRNTTDTPATRDLTPLFMTVIEKVTNLQGDAVYQSLLQQLLHVSADNEIFKKHLSGNLYDDNKGVCRYVLCSIEESRMTRESKSDLWEMNGKQLIWTIEHIFPQGKNIPQDWVNMMAAGNVAQANLYRDSHVHKLGNLTISGYNSKLGVKGFIEKRDRLDNKKRPVGYNNGLYLNEKLKDANDWSVEAIDKRTNELVELAIKLFSLPECAQ
ncbi:DUF262 domain-containing protein [Dasania marina]|uniref:DUF262 domain-containing protein n=1 Tax=Dasania marina TaxID=471499 RepID=UPI00037565EA|nr:DUF262 domain-containing protein [Dasania marina]